MRARMRARTQARCAHGCVHGCACRCVHGCVHGCAHGCITAASLLLRAHRRGISAYSCPQQRVSVAAVLLMSVGTQRRAAEIRQHPADVFAEPLPVPVDAAGRLPHPVLPWACLKLPR
eukprot:gene12577-biopygen926